MDYKSMIDFITGVGFPIVVVFMMYKQNMEVLEKLRSVVEENTLAIKELSVKVNYGGDTDEDK